VRLVDLVFVKKSADGPLAVEEVRDLGAEDTREHESVVPNIQGPMTMEDIAEVTSDLPVQSSAAIALFEHTF
jgi:phage FluMu protein gp41